MLQNNLAKQSMKVVNDRYKQAMISDDIDKLQNNTKILVGYLT